MDTFFDCQYVVLAYAFDPTQEGFMPIAIAYRVLGGRAAHGLTLQVRAILRTTSNRKHGTQDGRPLRRYRRRWKVERLFAWPHNYRRLVNRWEYHIENFLGFVQTRLLADVPQAFYEMGSSWCPLKSH